MHWVLKLSLLATSLIVLKLWTNRRRVKKANPKNLPFPPGPKPLPVIGNLFDIPTDYGWFTAMDWAKKYGELVYVEALGTRIVYVDTLEVCRDLMEKRSAIYSDRPILTMAGELVGWINNLAFIPYGPRWRRVRRGFQQWFRAEAVQNYRLSQLLEARKMLLRLIETPNDFFHHIRHSAAATIMLVTYGIEVVNSDDKYIAAAETAVGHLSESCCPGAFLVDTIPALKYLPEWFPGAGFKKLARSWAKQFELFCSMPLIATKEAIANSTARHSVAVSMLKAIKDDQDIEFEEEIVKEVASSAYAGGADTTVSTIQSLFLAMALYPDVQRRAQEELDRVVGNGRLPEFSDRESLPYVNAVVKELLRWHPVLPTGVGHLTTNDDEYKGYFIPKGTMILGNIWSILHDPVEYPDPDRFIPERFLTAEGEINPEVQDPTVACFGFGRRICPGRHMALNSAFIAVASIIAALNIDHAVDESGRRINIKDEVTSQFLIYPKSFRCKIEPRFSNTVNLIEQSLKTCQVEVLS